MPFAFVKHLLEEGIFYLFDFKLIAVLTQVFEVMVTIDIDMVELSGTCTVVKAANQRHHIVV